MENFEQPTIRHKKVFPKNLEILEGMLFWIAQYALQNGFTKKESKDLEVAAEEVMANIIHHADTEEAIEVVLLITARTIAVTFIDEGKEFNPLEQKKPSMDRPLDEMSIGGLGIFLMQQLVDDVSYKRENGCNVLRLTKNKST